MRRYGATYERYATLLQRCYWLRVSALLLMPLRCWLPRYIADNTAGHYDITPLTERLLNYTH